MVSEDSVVVAIKEQISADSGSGRELLCLRNGQAYTLDVVGAQIWDFIQTPRKIREIQNRILEDHEGVDPHECRKDLLELLEALLLAGLVEVSPKEPDGIS